MTTSAQADIQERRLLKIYSSSSVFGDGMGGLEVQTGSFYRFPQWVGRVIRGLASGGSVMYPWEYLAYLWRTNPTRLR